MDEKNDKVVIMVYGTLKRGDIRHHALEGARFIGTVKTTKDWTLFSCGSFPALVKARSEEEQTGVLGELYEADKSLLDHTLDGIEGVPWLYDRGVVAIESVTPEDANEPQITEALTYVYQQSVNNLSHIGTTWDVNWHKNR
jgi:gamma-glutamylcyclotransferase (GGCT)/AIG2-like uncharacterized protein YtfP